MCLTTRPLPDTSFSNYVSRLFQFSAYSGILEFHTICLLLTLKKIFPVSSSFLHIYINFFSIIYLRPPQTTILPCCISFSWGWPWSPCKEIEENNRKGKTRNLFRKKRYQGNILCKHGDNKGQKWYGPNRRKRY